MTWGKSLNFPFSLEEFTVMQYMQVRLQKTFDI